MEDLYPAFGKVKVTVNPEWAGVLPRSLNHRPIYLRWLERMVDKEHVEHI